jgi:glycosyltransferase involved in cell wall biosynthesis
LKVLIVNDTRIPAIRYGGTERVIWCLGKELARMGHRVAYLVQPGSSCPFAEVLAWDRSRPLGEQVPDDVDLVHLHHSPPDLRGLSRPHVVTLHGNPSTAVELDRNTVFVSRNHASRFGSECFVHNGLDWDEYGRPDLGGRRSYVHFLGDAAWRVKNVRGAIRVARLAGERLHVLGGRRLNFRMGFRLTLSPRVRFFGWVGGEQKLGLLGGSKGLLYPVRWHEPFGLAIVESLYFGCPVFGTPYGSLPELVTPEVGHLSARAADLARAVREAGRFERRRCHDYAATLFSSRAMAQGYLSKYQQALEGRPLNPVSPRLQEANAPRLLPFD